MRKLFVVAILGLFGLSANGLTTRTGLLKGTGNTQPTTTTKETEIAVNFIKDNDTLVNLGLNGLVGYEAEAERSASHSFDLSKEDHHNSQKIDISINFNVGGNCHDHDCDSDSDSDSDNSCDESCASDCNASAGKTVERKGACKKGGARKNC